MAAELHTAPVAEMIPIIEAAVKDGRPVEMTVTGNSMRPLLIDRVSAVRLMKPTELKKGDVVLFRRCDGKYVLHRIAAVNGRFYDIIGDSQYTPDRNVPEDRIIARVAEYSRDGKRWKEKDALYLTFLPLIRTVRRCGGKIVRAVCKEAKK